MAEITLQSPWGLLALPVAWLLLVAFAWRRRFKPFGAFLLRLTIMVLVALALSQPVYLQPEGPDNEPAPRLVWLIDHSASLGPVGRQVLRAEAARLAREFPDSLALFFADRPVMVPLSNLLLTGNEDLAVLPLDPEISNLAGALLMGAELLDGQPGRLVLLSDGLPTTGDTVQAALQLAQKTVPVDVLILSEDKLRTWADGSNEVRLTKLNVPPVLRQGETFNIEVVMHSLIATEVTLRLTHTSHGVVLAEDVISLEPGSNLFTFETEAETVGPQTFRATIAAAGDNQLANNSFSAFTQVYPPPQILVVGDEPLQLSRFSNQLEQAGFVTEQIPPADLPDHLSELEPYAGMALLNVSARSLRLEQMIAVQEFVRSLGRGLLVTGGRDSFSLGHYEDTPLADLLPVSLEPPPREERPPVALLLMIDHSGSMVEKREPATRLAMAKAAAIRATDILGPEDLIGVLIFDNRYEWVVPFQPVSDGATLLEIQQAIATIPAGGGTRILQALTIGLPALAEQEATSGARHAVLLTDGKSFDGAGGIENYNLVVDAALEANITLSTIAIGSGADQELLTHLAERGMGRYHFAAVPDELPALTIAESDILRSNAVQEGEFRPVVFTPHPLLRGLCLDSRCLQETNRPGAPNLSGYVALTPKPRAEMALQIGPGDPLLSAWGYGLGRVVTWTSDTGGEWASDWPAWDKAVRFWGQVMGYTLPAPDLGLLQLEAEVEPNGIVTLTADSVTATGQTVDLALTQATLTPADGQAIPLTLRQVSPGRYQQRLHLPDPGAYQWSVIQARTDAPDETATIGFVVPYPAEYSLPEAGTGQALLGQIAAMTGGHTFSLGESVLDPGCDPQLEDCGTAPLPAVSPGTGDQRSKSVIQLWPWLLQIALILWPIEIAWRRWGRLRIQ